VALADRTDFWTTADQAELELLAHELVRAAFIHRERCSVCSAPRIAAARDICAPMLDAIRGVVEWRDGRILRSKAAWLRELQTALEAAA
jgi:hypothetical protein